MNAITIKSIYRSKEDDVRRLAKFLGIDKFDSLSIEELIHELQWKSAVETETSTGWGSKAWVAAKDYRR